MVMHQPSKLCMSVRFRLPAPTELPSNFNRFLPVRVLVSGVSVRADTLHPETIILAGVPPPHGLGGAGRKASAALAGEGRRTRSSALKLGSFTVDGPGISLYIAAFLPRAQMAELVDALRSGRSSRKGVEVRVLFWAPGSFLSASFSVRESLQNSI